MSEKGEVETTERDVEASRRSTSTYDSPASRQLHCSHCQSPRYTTNTQGFDVYNQHLGQTICPRVFIVQFKGNRFELAADAGRVGATGAISCLRCPKLGIRVAPSTTYCLPSYSPFQPDNTLVGGNAESVLPVMETMPAHVNPLSQCQLVLKDPDAWLAVVELLESGQINPETKKTLLLVSGVSRRPVYKDIPLF
ncbi:hypothetical protein OF846_005037 [Rhodotorula toruloides]|nr:hypothetical protein OF846_005037 [Rhodotorula toruloides]